MLERKIAIRKHLNLNPVDSERRKNHVPGPLVVSAFGGFDLDPKSLFCSLFLHNITKRRDVANYLYFYHSDLGKCKRYDLAGAFDVS